MTTIDSPDKSLQGYYAGAVSRLIAIILDIVIINIVLLLIGWFLSIILSLFNNLSTLGFNLDRFSSIKTIFGIITNPIFVAFFIVAIIFLYFTFFIVFSGHTPGKAFMGLRVVTIDGGKISFYRSAIRFFAYIPSILSLGIGFFWLIFDDQRQAWHDTLSKTIVIYIWDARPDEKFLARQISGMEKRGKKGKSPQY